MYSLLHPNIQSGETEKVPGRKALSAFGKLKQYIFDANASHDRFRKRVAIEVARLEKNYGSSAYVEAWFELAESGAFGRDGLVMEAALEELGQRRGVRSGDRETIDFHRDVGGTA